MLHVFNAVIAMNGVVLMHQTSSLMPPFGSIIGMCHVAEVEDDSTDRVRPHTEGIVIIFVVKFDEWKYLSFHAITHNVTNAVCGQ